jgi:hypothetical protein
MSTSTTRRDFLASSAGAVAMLTFAAVPEIARADSRPEPTGTVYGRVGGKGLPPGTVSVPSRGEVVLIDGRVLEAAHVTSRGIAAGRSVLLSQDESGSWSVLYAEI